MISHHIVAAYALARQQSLLDEARHDHARRGSAIRHRRYRL
jgi:hypothetical protein